MLINIRSESGVVLSEDEKAMVDPSFQWKCKDGRHLYPRDMQTSHLFHTFRMLWNNLNKESLRVGAVRLYNFGSYYHQPGYFQSAILNIGHELSKRHFLPSQLGELRQMQDLLTGQSQRIENDF